MEAAKAQANMRKHAVSPDPSLLADIKRNRWWIKPKFMTLVTHEIASFVQN